MKDRSLKFSFNKDNHGSLKINGLTVSELSYVIALIVLQIEEKSENSQSEILKAISDTNEIMRKDRE